MGLNKNIAVTDSKHDTREKIPDLKVLFIVRRQIYT